MDYGTLDDRKGVRRKAMAATVARLSRPDSWFLLWCFYAARSELPFVSFDGASRLSPAIEPGEEGAALGRRLRHRAVAGVGAGQRVRVFPYDPKKLGIPLPLMENGRGLAMSGSGTPEWDSYAPSSDTADVGGWRILETMPDAIVISDHEGRIVFANIRAEELTGYPRDELAGMLVEALVPGDLRETHVSHRAGYCREPRSRPMGVGLDLVCLRKDGSEVPIDVSLSPLDPDEDGPLVVAALRDVTRRRATERALVEAEAKYRGVVENAVAGIFITSVDGKYLSANAGLADLLGYSSAGELMASVADVRELYVDGAERDEFLRRMGAEGAIRGFEYRVRRKDGGVVWVSETVRSIRDPDGNLVAFEGMSIDITEKRRAEEMLRRRDAILEAVAFAAGRLLKVSHWEDGIGDVLQRLGEATGVSRVVVYENHLGEDGSLLVSGRHEWRAPGVASEIQNPPNQSFPWRGGGFERWADVLGEGGVVQALARDAPEGERRMYEAVGVLSIAAVPVFCGDEWWGYIGFGDCSVEREWSQPEIDVLRTAAEALGAAIVREQAETALAERENLLRTVVDAEPECVKLVARDGTLLEMNRAGLDMIEADSFEQVAGCSVFPIVAPEHREAFESLTAGVFRGSRGMLEFEIVGLKGTHRWLETHAVPLRDAEGEVTALLGITRDVTERKRTEDELQSSFDRLRRTYEGRRRLLARLVDAQEDERQRIAGDIHDDSIQKMTAVGMRLQTLRRGLEDRAQIEALGQLEELVASSIDRLRHLVFDLRSPTLDRHGLAAAIREHAEHSDGDARLTYAVENRLTAEPPDETRVIAYRIVQEALANVRRHARAGRVDVVLGSKEGGLFVRVHDDGVGFAPAEIERDRPGHLGATAMRERAELAGGWLRLQSAPGRGTTVEFWLPGQAVDAGS